MNMFPVSGNVFTRWRCVAMPLFEAAELMRGACERSASRRRRPKWFSKESRA